MIYAQINAAQVVVALSHLGGVVDDPHMIAVDVYDPGLIGQVYDDATGTFAAAPAPEPIISTLMPKAFWFLRLTQDETKFFNRMRKRTAALTDADYDDPAKDHLVQWEGFLVNYDQLGNEIDLAHPLVAQGVGAFITMFVMETGGESTGIAPRVTELLTPPVPS